MPLWVIGLIIVGGIILVLISTFIVIYNKLVNLSVGVDEGFATIDVYLKQRYDLVPNLVNTVKGYVKHEKETLENIVKLRTAAMGATTPEDKMKLNNELTQAVGKLIAVAEAYPDLKANTNFTEIQNSLQKIEEDIANGRKYYNATVKDYNRALMVFPNNIVANIFHFKPKAMFAIENAKEREAVKVEF